MDKKVIDKDFLKLNCDFFDTFRDFLFFELNLIEKFKKITEILIKVTTTRRKRVLIGPKYV